ncbi:MAG: sigma-54-dependent Fis family transcriptional regulator [Deltaproteobacteria bacterium]|nr:sigma-54-dependent Fis family transcriptional regulator [Deltaproteobacteria bacterium]MBM4346945.1 sigma-54-dependent Fis family transcriptional regulator [Deltaproteobacteria bacterium]
MKPSILIVDDDDVLRETLSDVLKKAEYEVHSVGSGGETLSVLKRNIIDLILLDMKLPDVDGLELLKKIKEFDTEILVIIMTAYSDVQNAVSAMKSGAYHYINKPFDLEELRLLIEKGLETTSLINEVRRLHRQHKEENQKNEIYGNTPQIQYVRELIGMISKTNKTSVLIQGESGTGKELAANAIHYNSKRALKPLMKINCSAIPDSLLESELFGYEKGAFTDAKTTKKGLFELADGGTVFLDEIGDMKPFLQSKILRVIENQSFMRVGGEREIKVDVRIIAATNRDLEVLVKEGLFRKDLYYRLKVMVVEMPPLREREEDILLLSSLFVEEINREYSKNINGLTDDAKKIMVQYSWPGNVRELKNVIERAMILAEQAHITPKQLPFELRQSEGYFSKPTDTNRLEFSEIMPLETMEQVYLANVLKKMDKNKSKASKILGISRATLRAKIKKYHLSEN